MTEEPPPLSKELPPGAHDYLGHRLDGARDLYLLALALGDRPEGSALFGRMIREARIHFAAVIEEARIAGLDTGAIAAMLGKRSIELADNIRPELWAGVEKLLAERVARRAPVRRGRP
ncbi:MAG TPA: hypothetical protein VFP28_07905 [Gemmatimonadales bacterium]|nr:hypothetical protein [Gemmatimonadales bacterium]